MNDDIEKQVYAEKKYKGKIRALLLVFTIAALVGLAGLAAVLYAFHLDPDTNIVETVHQGCPHTGCGDPHAKASYGSWEVGVSGLVYVAYLCLAGFFAGVATER